MKLIAKVGPRITSWMKKKVRKVATLFMIWKMKS